MKLLARALIALLLIGVVLALASPLLRRAESLPQPLGRAAHILRTLGSELRSAASGGEVALGLGRCRYRAGGALPDPRCTPGAAFAHVALATMCAYGYTARVRDVSEATKRAIYAAYGIERHYPGEYEIDHLIPLDIGGSNARANLWPQPAPAYHVKDRLEARLGREVCAGRVSLRAAQQAIAANWTTAAQRLGLRRQGR